MIKSDNLLFSNSFKHTELKFVLPFIIATIACIILLALNIIQSSVLLYKIVGIPILLIVLVLGLIEFIISIFKLFLQINIKLFNNVPTLLLLIVSISIFLLSMFYWKHGLIQCMILLIAVLITSPDSRFNNPSLAENIIISAIRLFTFSLLCVYIFKYLSAYIKYN